MLFACVFGLMMFNLGQLVINYRIKDDLDEIERRLKNLEESK